MLRHASLCALLVLLPLASSLSAPSAMSAESSPIAKVVTLISDMKAQCIKDGEEDTAAYDKYKCWCETTTEEKEAAIASAKSTIEELEGFLGEAAAKEASLKTELEGLAEDIAADKTALQSATEMRNKENEEFLAEEADFKETLGLLSEAIGVLSKVQLMQKSSKAHGKQIQASLLQVKKLAKRIPQKMFGNVMQKDLWDMFGSFETMAEQHLGSVFLPKRRAAAFEQSWRRQGVLPWIKSEEQIGKEANPNDQHGAAAGAKSYNSRSGGILGLLKQMGDQVAEDLAGAQKEEMTALVGFQKLQAAKTAEIDAATEQSNQKEKELSELLYKASEAKEDVEKTSKALAADEAFLAETTKGCEIEDQEYAKRVKVRTQEIEALSETMEILTGDEARSLFDKTINFLQISSHAVTSAAQERARGRAVKSLLKMSHKSGNWALASLAVSVRLDAFTKVKAAMDKMVAELTAQQKAEYEKNEVCKKELDETEDKIKVATNEKNDLADTHKELTNSLETLAADIQKLKDEVAEMEVDLKKAGENRKSENQLYQVSINNQRATITILTMAMDRLKKFYTPSAGLLQAKAAPPPKPSANAYEKSSSSGGVMQMLAKIIGDAEATEAELKLSEQHAQEDYSEFVSATTASIEADREAIAEKEDFSAKASADKSETEESQLANDASLAKLEELLAATHASCDWIMKYFDLRQKTRKEEMDAIEEAKAILSGAKFA